MGRNYILVNPYIEGSFKKKYNAENSIKAAEKCYKNLSQYFGNTVKKFQFSLLKVSSDDLETDAQGIDFYNYLKSNKDTKLKNTNFSHFLVTEKKKDDDVNYSINTFNCEINKKDINTLMSNIIKIQNKYKKTVINAKYRKKKSSKGSKKPKKKDSDSSDSSNSDSSILSKKSYSSYDLPLFWYWHYYLGLYPYDNYYMPLFSPYIGPYPFFAFTTSSASRSNEVDFNLELN